MRWSSDSGDAPPGGWGGSRIMIDGEDVTAHVTAFDTEAGWLDMLCLEGHTGTPGYPHASPGNPDAVCMAPRRHGVVGVEVAG